MIRDGLSPSSVLHWSLIGRNLNPEATFLRGHIFQPRVERNLQQA